MLDELEENCDGISTANGVLLSTRAEPIAHLRSTQIRFPLLHCSILPRLLEQIDGFMVHVLDALPDRHIGGMGEPFDKSRRLEGCGKGGRRYRWNREGRRRGVGVVGCMTETGPPAVSEE